MSDDVGVHPGRDFCNVVEILLRQRFKIAVATVKKVGYVRWMKVDGAESQGRFNCVDGADDILVRGCRLVGIKFLLDTKVDVNQIDRQCVSFFTMHPEKFEHKVETDWSTGKIIKL